MAKASDEFKSKLLEASKALHEAENILRAEGLNVPEENVALNDFDRIQIPKGYIRTVKEFREKYELDDHIGIETLCRNLAYALQTSDFINYLLNRFNIGLSVGQLFYKLAIINMVSALEGILYGIVKRLNRFCRENGVVCKHNANCAYYVKSPNKYNFPDLLDCLREKAILELGEKIEDILKEIKGLRDNVHIWDVEDNEYLSQKYTRLTYNKLVLILRRIRDELPNGLSQFKEERNDNCTKMEEIFG